MTLLGVPEGTGFSIGTSSSIVPQNGTTSVDMSLDDMIKSRRRSQRTTKSSKSASPADKAIGRSKANRQAKLNAKRGLRTDSKATSMEIEKEVYRQSRKSPTNRTPTNNNSSSTNNKNRRSRRVADQRVKAKNETKKQQQKTKNNGNNKNDPAVPPAWIGGTRRPPSKKAITAAVSAMQGAGFKVPKGMQMVISFAPAPNEDPTKNNPEPKKNAKKGNAKTNNNNNNKGNNNNNNRGRNNRQRK
eukprot:CAMPEP_0116550388 /NCGR_PEP_ID=MMETSP0397-20121206/5401_1 /TAXON_ID=216820 /ORGANISM="Cyclophora tenuis, Strain ECT3854" /LENGTH=243 /DNA_ID=CAMNT_0004075217 /DNA_START=41 /DNA_END=772 /DNA_ORIENTATION=+